MLHTCLDILLTELNSHIKSRTGIAEDKVIFANLAEAANSPGNSQIVMSLADIAQSEQRDDTQSYIPQGNSFIAKNPPVTLKIYVLFSSCFPTAQTLEGLQYLSLVIAFFQSKNYFDTTNTPALQAAHIGQLSVKLTDWDQREKSNLWSRLSVPYKPSVLYRVDTILIEDMGDMGIQVPEVKGIYIN